MKSQFIHTYKGTLSAMLVYGVCLLLLCLLGILFQAFPLIQNHYYAVVLCSTAIPLIVIPLIIYLCSINHLTLADIGIRKQNIGKSLAAGFLLSMVIVLFRYRHSAAVFTSYRDAGIVIACMFYYLVPVAILEEITFRAFIPHTISKNKKHAYMLSGILFSALHLPFRFIMSNMAFPVFLASRVISCLVIYFLHFMFQKLYDTYGNCGGPIMLHFVIDFFQLLSF